MNNFKEGTTVFHWKHPEKIISIYNTAVQYGTFHRLNNRGQDILTRYFEGKQSMEDIAEADGVSKSAIQEVARQSMNQLLMYNYYEDKKTNDITDAERGN